MKLVLDEIVLGWKWFWMKLVWDESGIWMNVVFDELVLYRTRSHLAFVPATLPQVASCLTIDSIKNFIFFNSQPLVASLRSNDRCTLGTVIKLQTSCCSLIFIDWKAKWSSRCVSQVSLPNVLHYSIHRDLDGILSFRNPTLCTIFVTVFTFFITRIERKDCCNRLSVWRGSGLISRFFIVFIWISRLVLLCPWYSLDCLSATVFILLCCDDSCRCCCGPLLRESSRSWCDGTSWGLNCEGLRGRDFFLGPTLPPRAGDHSGGRPDGPGGSESLEVSKVHQVQMEHQDRQRILANGQLVSSPPSFSGVMIWGWRPKFSFQKTIIVHAQGSNEVHGFSREAPKRGLTAGLKDVELASESALESYNNQFACSARNHV